MIFNLSTSIYDLVLIYVCHFHHHFLLLLRVTFPQFCTLSRYSCCYLGSLHPRNFTLGSVETQISYSHFDNTSWKQFIFLIIGTVHVRKVWKTIIRDHDFKKSSIFLSNQHALLKKLLNNWFHEIFCAWSYHSTVHCSVEIREILSHLKISREINSLATSLIKTLLFTNFFLSVRENFSYFHTGFFNKKYLKSTFA